MEKITLPQVRDLGQIIGDPFLFLRENFKIIFKAFLYYIVPLLVVEVALLLLGAKTTTPLYTQHSSSFSRMGSFLILGYLIGITASLIQQFYIIEFMVLKEHQQDVTNAEVLSKMKEDAGTFISTFFALIPFSIAAVAAISLVAYVALLCPDIIKVPLFIALVVLCFYGFVALSNLFFIKLREKISIGQSLTKSFKIMAGSWWKTVASWLVLIIIFYCVASSAIMFLGFGVFVFNFHDLTTGGGDSTAQAGFLKAIMGITATLGTFIFHFMANLMTVFIGINYFSLSEQYDNYHLKEQINLLGGEQENTPYRQEGEY